MLAAELLLAHAAELAASADGRDQLLSACLSAGAADIATGVPPLNSEPRFALQIRRVDPGSVARAQIEGCSDPASRASAMRLADAIFREAAQIQGRDAAKRRFLRDFAALQAGLWSAAEIPAESGVRLEMMLSAPIIFDMARQRGAFRCMRDTAAAR